MQIEHYMMGNAPLLLHTHKPTHTWNSTTCSALGHLLFAVHHTHTLARSLTHTYTLTNPHTPGTARRAVHWVICFLLCITHTLTRSLTHTYTLTNPHTPGTARRAVHSGHLLFAVHHTHTHTLTHTHSHTHKPTHTWNSTTCSALGSSALLCMTSSKLNGWGTCGCEDTRT